VQTTLTIANFFSDPSEQNPSDIITIRTGTGGIPVNIVTPEPASMFLSLCAVGFCLTRWGKPKL
jgi:hypothetical protein